MFGFDLRQAQAIRPLCRSGRAEQLARVALTFRGEATMSVRSCFLIVAIGCSAATALSAAFAETEPKSVARQSLKSPSEFESIGDQPERSRAIFAEIGKLLMHPRCMSCHPAGDHPLQGADHHEHMPPVWRSDAGNLGPHCAQCHTDNNVALPEPATFQSIPGHPRGGLA